MTVFSCLLLVLEDVLESAASLDPGLRFWRTVLSIAGYVFRSTACLGLLLVVVRPEHRRSIVWIPIAFNLLVCSTAFFTDLAFGFDENYVFYRGPLGYVPFIVPLIYLGVLLWLSFTRYNEYSGRSDRLILLCCAAFCLLSALLDATQGGTRLHDAIMISSICFFIFLRTYSREQREIERKRQYLIENIDRAITERWIQVYYQPIVSTADETVCDEEALARWKDPVEGFMSPDDFIPILEQNGLLYKLDLCVLDQVLGKIRRKTEAGVPVVPQSINISRSDFDSCDIVEEIRKRVDAVGVPRKMISIEITESVIGGDFDFIREQIIRFRSLGFPVWMDDFGSGYSTLNVLQSIPFDLIKFEMSFMKRLHEGDRGKIILTDMMRMASTLHAETICEGVETEAQMRFLQEIGCTKMQGYYFGKPVPEEKANLRAVESSLRHAGS